MITAENLEGITRVADLYLEEQMSGIWDGTDLYWPARTQDEATYVVCECDWIARLGTEDMASVRCCNQVPYRLSGVSNNGTVWDSITPLPLSL